VSDPYDALENANALLVVTEWSEFKVPDFDQIFPLEKQVIRYP